ncbi:MAG: transporter [Pseudomonadota bacterium]
MKRILGHLVFSLAAISHTPFLLADASHRPDFHAPIGVMGDHTHKKGEWMVSYRFMHMSMEDVINDDDNIAIEQVLSPDGLGYMVTPLEMPMDMHMVGVMFAPTDKLTLSLMGSFIDIEMDHVTRMGVEFTTEADGYGDTKIGALYQLSSVEDNSLVFNFSLSVPTGDIDQTGVTPASMGAEVPLPYPMQIGSGTYDVTTGFTFSGFRDGWSWGNQALYTHRFDENDNGYTLGNKFHISSWASYLVTEQASISARLTYLNREDIEGADSRLNPMMIFTADPALYAKEQVDFAVGLNWKIQALRVAVEYSAPVWYWVDGPQLEVQHTATAGLQYSF